MLGSMKSLSYRVFAVALLSGLALTSLGGTEAEESETLRKFRESFEKRLNQELDQSAEQARKLRGSYLGALKRLKITLGKENNLKAAAQVLTEIENVENGETKPLADSSERRLLELRQTWESTLEKLLDERGKTVASIGKTYLAALEKEKQRLTKAGKIREALGFEEELERVAQLPEFKAAFNQGDEERELRGKVETGNVALATRGAKAEAPERATYLNDGRDDNAALYSRGTFPCQFEITLSDLYVLDRIRVYLYDGDRRRYRYEVEVSADNTNWENVLPDEGKGVRGWQTIKFEPRDVKYIRVKGLSNTENEYVHVIEIEAYCPKGR